MEQRGSEMCEKGLLKDGDSECVEKCECEGKKKSIWDDYECEGQMHLSDYPGVITEACL